MKHQKIKAKLEKNIASARKIARGMKSDIKICEKMSPDSVKEYKAIYNLHNKKLKELESILEKMEIMEAAGDGKGDDLKDTSKAFATLSEEKKKVEHAYQHFMSGLGKGEKHCPSDELMVRSGKVSKLVKDFKDIYAALPEDLEKIKSIKKLLSDTNEIQKKLDTQIAELKKNSKKDYCVSENRQELQAQKEAFKGDLRDRVNKILFANLKMDKDDSKKKNKASDIPGKLSLNIFLDLVSKIPVYGLALKITSRVVHAGLSAFLEKGVKGKEPLISDFILKYERYYHNLTKEIDNHTIWDDLIKELKSKYGEEEYMAHLEKATKDLLKSFPSNDQMKQIIFTSWIKSSAINGKIVVHVRASNDEKLGVLENYTKFDLVEVKTKNIDEKSNAWKIFMDSYVDKNILLTETDLEVEVFIKANIAATQKNIEVKGFNPLDQMAVNIVNDTKVGSTLVKKPSEKNYKYVLGLKSMANDWLKSGQALPKISDI